MLVLPLEATAPPADPGVHPILLVLSDARVVSSLAAAVAALAGLFVAYMRRQEQRINGTLTRIQDRVSQAKDAAVDAKHSVTNSHEVHLRDDLDGKFDSLFQRLDILGTVTQGTSERVDNLVDRVDNLVDRVDRSEHLSESRDLRAEQDIADLRDWITKISKED